MLNEDDFQFLEEHDIARMLYYRSVCIDKDRADEMFRFLREAHTRHFPVTLSVECQGVVASISLSFDRGGPGWELYNYLGPWILAMSWKDASIRDEMAKIWPGLSEWYAGHYKRGTP